MKEISEIILKDYEKKFNKNKGFILSSNAVQRNGINNVAFVSEATRNLTPIYSNEVKDIGSITNQKQSGRCWMFAALNVLRQILMKKLQVKDIELSESYLMFYDKLEKSNVELEETIKHIDEDFSSRIFDTILYLGGQGDGGYWHYFVELVKKYGVCPKDSMPETKDSSSSYAMDEIINKLLAKDVIALKEAYKNGKDKSELHLLKDKMIEEIYNVLRISIGKPVDKFIYEYHEDNKEVKDEDEKKDKKEDKKDENDFKRIEMSPKEFYDKYIGKDLDDYVSLVNWPIEKWPYYQTYTYKIINNVVGGKKSKSLNVPIIDLKEVTIKSLKDNKICWFACDVDAYSMSKDGYLAQEILNYESIFNSSFDISKGDRLLVKASSANHAMCLGGVNLDKKGKPNKWKVINSWGKEYSFNGCLVMSDKWFDTFVYEVIVDKKYLSEKMLEALKTKPIGLDPWDPVCRVSK